MSFFLSPYLARLQDLKLWQGNYDNMLLQQQNSDVLSSIDSLSCLDTVETPKNVQPSSTKESPKSKIMNDWDKQTIAQVKPFDQLLEEKLKDEQPSETQTKPKKPFLRKGSGLIRYKSYKPLVKPKKSDTKYQVKQKQNPNPSQNGNYSKDDNAPFTSPLNKCKKNTVNEIIDLDYDLNADSLKMPNAISKPKATWYSIMSNKNNVDKHESVYNNSILNKFNQFVFPNFTPTSPKKTAVPNKSNNIVEISCSNDIPSTKSIFEYTSDKDLKIFEVLEERVEHSSFSSNNSSIARLLSSTPNKIKLKPANSPILEELHSPKTLKFDDIPIPNQEHHRLEQKQQVLHDFLCNLRKIVDDKDIQVDFGDLASEKKNSSPNSSYSENWSSNTDTRTQSPSSFYTDFENTLKSMNTRIDVAVNTSFNETADQRVQISTECENCEQLQQRLQQLMKDIPNIQAEKAKVCDFAKDLERKRDELKKEMEKMKSKNHETISDLRHELQVEKKKFDKEKAVFDMYIKESQNRPSRKEREEISNLKKELTEFQELQKLKDAKNGATQARLRTQIKQIEKEKNDLKNDIERLQKENARLNASKKLARPSEVKMLHEINKNLTKLTTEALKNQMNKSHHASNTDEVNVNISSKSKLIKQIGGNRDSINKTSLEILEMENIEIERRYENVFGQLESNFQNPAEKINLNDSKPGKSEKLFPDGSKEITYSNGNTKTISPDGNIIIIQYYNGDVKETNLLKNIMKYFYAENGTWHTQFGDGSELLEYSNGQKEKKYNDGKREVTCPDGTFLTKLPDGTEEFIYPDGSKMIKHINGEKIILLPNGQKEIHSSENKRREYPDGTVKILYFDGTQETRYPSGRIRIKDPSGVLIMDK